MKLLGGLSIKPYTGGCLTTPCRLMCEACRSDWQTGFEVVLWAVLNKTHPFCRQRTWNYSVCVLVLVQHRFACTLILQCPPSAPAGTTRYTLDQAGLISRHEETWDISATDALVSTFIPSFGAPPAPPVVQ